MDSPETGVTRTKEKERNSSANLWRLRIFGFPTASKFSGRTILFFPGQLLLESGWNQKLKQLTPKELARRPAELTARLHLRTRNHYERFNGWVPGAVGIHDPVAGWEHVPLRGGSPFPNASMPPRFRFRLVLAINYSRKPAKYSFAA